MTNKKAEGLMGQLSTRVTVRSNYEPFNCNNINMGYWS